MLISELLGDHREALTEKESKIDELLREMKKLNVMREAATARKSAPTDLDHKVVVRSS